MKILSAIQSNSGENLVEPTDTRADQVGGGSGGLDQSSVEGIAAGSTLGLQQALLAGAGQPGLTVLAVGFMASTLGKVQGVSLGNGNVVEVYATGADFNDGNVLYREFMSLGEPIVFTGLDTGAIITSTAGFYGFSEMLDANDESPMPLLSYGLSFKKSFFFAFRNCQTYDPTGTSGNQGWVHIVNGPLESVIKLTNGAGATIRGQENVTLAPWQYHRFYTDGNIEYIIDSTNPVMACTCANMDSNPVGRFYDARLIMPMTEDGITWPRNGDLSALYDNTAWSYYVRDGAEGSFVTSPGTPQDINATGATDQDYEPNGATRFLATGVISAYSGADSAGLEASPLMPTAGMSQIVAQPFFIADTGDGGNSGVAIASPYEGTAKIYEWNDATSQLDLAYTVPLTRNIGGTTTREDQNHPAAGAVANDTVSGVIPLVGTLNAGIVVADVPIMVVAQQGSILTNLIRSQNGTQAQITVNDDDETLMLGITPAWLKAEITEDANGLLRKRVIDGSGVATFPLA